jgi:D-sedoheptulose 7-phosphate isomerase
MIKMKKFTYGSYVTNLISVISSVEHEKINSIVEVLLNARKNNKTIFIAGNGGSAATASHMVTDFMYSSKITSPKMKVYSLNENTSVLTATGNDKGFDEVFSRQLENLASDGDVLILISASGNSINLLNCLSLCEKKNITTIGLTGFDGGSLKSKVNISLHVQTEMGAYGIVEDTHMVVGHIITELLKVQSAKEDFNG